MSKKLILLFTAGLFFLIVFVAIKKINIPTNKTPSARTPTAIPAKVTNIPNINIDYLRGLTIDSPKTEIVGELEDGLNYKRYIARFESEGNIVFGLLTIPFGDVPEGGFSAIVFNHGYIPPNQYETTEKYEAYVDYLARNGFVVFKIDLRGNGDSEGVPTGSYFSSGYTIDAISALKSLQKLDYVNPQKIGMWGHSMAGNLVLRAMLVEDDIKAGVIWSGAVYSYEDFAKYRLNDGSYVRKERDPHYDSRDLNNSLSNEVSKLRDTPENVDFTNDFWSGISLTQNIQYLNAPLQLHHAINDPVVNIEYSRDLASVLEENGKSYSLYEYDGGEHNINSPYFEQAMQMTVEFFEQNL